MTVAKKKAAVKKKPVKRRARKPKPVHHESILEALLAAQSEIKPIKTDCVAEMEGGRVHHYASLSAIVEQVVPVYNKHGLWFTHTSDGDFITCILEHVPSGDSRKASMRMPDTRNVRNWHSVGSAISYCRRYTFVMVAGIATEDDDDANMGNDLPVDPDADNKPFLRLRMDPQQIEKIAQRAVEKGTSIDDVRKSYLTMSRPQELSEGLLDQISEKMDELRRMAPDAIAPEAAKSSEADAKVAAEIDKKSKASKKADAPEKEGE